MKNTQPDSKWDTSDDEVLSSIKKRMKKEKKTNDCKWSKVDPVFRKWNVGCNLEEFTKDKINIEAFKDLNPVEIYEKFLDDSTIKYIVEQTLLYAVQNNRHDFTVNEEEIRTFIAILFLSGYHQLPQERMYWCNEEDLGLEIVSKAMPRNKYDQIKQNIHFVDNSKIDTTDKMFKLRPLMNILNEKFKQWGIFHTYLSIDEAMVRYFGRHSAKQFIRGKPTRFGYKNWVLASFDGYCYHFDTYCGKNKMENVSVSLGSNVVLNLLENIENPSNHAVFFDNYFSTLHLMSTLTNRGFRATATIRKNRISKCPLKSSKILSKQPRGNFDFQFDTNHDLLVVRWVDNNVVNMITNYDTIQPLHKVKRWSRKDKKVTEVSQPQLFNTYNKRMGGVDLSDLSVNTYRISIRGKKWWWVLFTYMLDLSLTNAWKLYQLSSGKKITQLEFTRYIVRHYLFRANKTQRRQSSLPLGVQFDNLGHFPQRIDNPLRCRVCHSKIRWICKKCKHTLCVEKNCFELYHTP